MIRYVLMMTFILQSMDVVVKTQIVDFASTGQEWDHIAIIKAHIRSLVALAIRYPTYPVFKMTESRETKYFGMICFSILAKSHFLKLDKYGIECSCFCIFKLLHFVHIFHKFTFFPNFLMWYVSKIHIFFIIYRNKNFLFELSFCILIC